MATFVWGESNILPDYTLKHIAGLHMQARARQLAAVSI